MSAKRSIPTKHLKHFLWKTKTDERGRGQVRKKARKKALLKPCLKQDEVCEDEGSGGKIESENCHQQVNLPQGLSYSKEDHRKFPEGRGGKILKGNSSWFMLLELLQTYTNYILEAEEEAVRGRNRKSLGKSFEILPRMAVTPEKGTDG